MSEPSRVAVFPGSFDPFTLGHVDVTTRSAALFDRVVVAVLVNPGKQPLFALEDRVTIIRDAVRALSNVEVDSFSGLLVDYMARQQATAVVRGLRSVTDFDYEMQMALMNRHLSGAVDTVFLAPSQQYAHISSRLVRDIIAVGGTVDGLVPPEVTRRLVARQRPPTGRQA